MNWTVYDMAACEIVATFQSREKAIEWASAYSKTNGPAHVYKTGVY